MKLKSKIGSKLVNLETEASETFGLRDRGEAKHLKSLTQDCLEARQLSPGLPHWLRLCYGLNYLTKLVS